MKRQVTLFLSTLAFSLVTLAPMANALNCIHGPAETPVCEGNKVYFTYNGYSRSGNAEAVFANGKIKAYDPVHETTYWVEVSQASPDVGFLNGLERGNCAQFTSNGKYLTGTVKAIFANGVVEIHSGGSRYFSNISGVGKQVSCIR